MRARRAEADGNLPGLWGRALWTCEVAEVRGQEGPVPGVGQSGWRKDLNPGVQLPGSFVLLSSRFVLPVSGPVLFPGCHSVSWDCPSLTLPGSPPPLPRSRSPPLQGDAAMGAHSCASLRKRGPWLGAVGCLKEWRRWQCLREGREEVSAQIKLAWEAPGLVGVL